MTCRSIFRVTLPSTRATAVPADWGGNGGITAEGNTQMLVNEDVIFDFTNYIDVGSNGGAIDLANSTITSRPRLIADDLVVSEGTFAGANGTINWRVESRFDDGMAILYNTITLTSTVAVGQPAVHQLSG